MKKVVVIRGPWKGIVSHNFVIHGNAVEIQLGKKTIAIAHINHCEVTR
jgi:hypothetical protein